MSDKTFSQSEMLLEEAKKARENSYSPYSGFKVGAALLCSSGKIYTGCNIENAAYSPTVCAERVAFFKALSERERDFTAIAIVGGSGEDTDEPCPPCGVCRQVMAEFCDADSFKIYLIGKELTLSELLPYGFGKDNVR